MRRLLLFSNSTMQGENYMQWTLPYIEKFMEGYDGKDILFIPFAGISLSDEGFSKSYYAYEAKVNEALKNTGLKVASIHRYQNMALAVKNSDSIMIGGGNTFHLVYMLYKHKLINALRIKALSGTPYIGWSAGSNVACPSLKTTNDMPIIMPENFTTLNLVPFQINPHYLDKQPAGFGGETRDDRIKEFSLINKRMNIVGLREGTLLEVHNHNMELKGTNLMKLFNYSLMKKIKKGEIKQYPEYQPGNDVNFLLK